MCHSLPLLARAPGILSYGIESAVVMTADLLLRSHRASLTSSTLFLRPDLTKTLDV
jgi:hypothetical protein